MFWITMAAIVMGVLLFKMGVLSVLVVLLAAAFKFALVIIILLMGLLLWRHFRRSRQIPWSKP